MSKEKSYCRQARLSVKAALSHASTLVYGPSRSMMKGAGFEYIDFREYTWGDDVRYIDWRLSARNIGYDGSLRLIVKEFQTEHKVHVLLAVDLGCTIGFGDKVPAQIYALTLILELAHRFEDKISLVVTGSQGIEVYPSMEPRNALRLVVNNICHRGLSEYYSLDYIVDTMKKIKRLRGIVLFTDYSHELDEYIALSKVARSLGASLGVVLATTKYELVKPVDKAYGIYFFGNRDTERPMDIDTFYNAVHTHVNNIRAALYSSRASVVELMGYSGARAVKHSILNLYRFVRERNYGLYTVRSTV